MQKSRQEETDHMSEIEVRHLSKTFTQKDLRVDALSDININIEKGDIYGIIGMSGAGKSTLVRCLNYLERPSDGQVIVRGQEMGALSEKELRDARMKIAMIFQSFNLLQQKNSIDNISFPLRIQGKTKKEARARAKELLKTVGLSDKAKSYPSQLSGGQQQRVAIARALACDPDILLCDEATSALDPQTTDQILQLIREINETLHLTIVIITHQMSVIQKICNRVAIIENGHLVEEGNVADIFAHPKSHAAKELILRDVHGDTPALMDPVDEITEGKKIRIVFSANSVFEPVVANMILKFGQPVNILKANTKNVGGVAKGDMILQLPVDRETRLKMEDYLKERGLDVEEVTN